MNQFNISIDNLKRSTTQAIAKLVVEQLRNQPEIQVNNEVLTMMGRPPARPPQPLLHNTYIPQTSWPTMIAGITLKGIITYKGLNLNLQFVGERLVEFTFPAIATMQYPAIAKFIRDKTRRSDRYPANSIYHWSIGYGERNVLKNNIDAKVFIAGPNFANDIRYHIFDKTKIVKVEWDLDDNFANRLRSFESQHKTYLKAVKTVKTRDEILTALKPVYLEKVLIPMRDWYLALPPAERARI